MPDFARVPTFVSASPIIAPNVYSLLPSPQPAERNSGRRWQQTSKMLEARGTVRDLAFAPSSFGLRLVRSSRVASPFSCLWLTLSHSSRIRRPPSPPTRIFVSTHPLHLHPRRKRSPRPRRTGSRSLTSASRPLSHLQRQLPHTRPLLLARIMLEVGGVRAGLPRCSVGRQRRSRRLERRLGTSSTFQRSPVDRTVSREETTRWSAEGGV